MNGILNCKNRGLSPVAVRLLAFALMTTGLFFHAMAAYAYPATQCAPSRFGSSLNCTANDVSINNITIAGTPPPFCIGGQSILLDLNVTIQFQSPSRYDIGVFVSADGKSPQALPPTGAGSCTVAVLPTSSPFLNLDGDSCGDGSGAISGGTGAGTFMMSSVAVPCVTDGSGNAALSVPYLVTWDQGSGNLCSDNTFPVPGTTSKCNTGTVAFPPGFSITVLPQITITDGVTTVRSGDALTYTVIITNTTASPLSAGAIFTDPAVANLSISGVSCAAAGGATCPGILNVAAMQGGLTLPAMPNNSTLTFTITGTYTGNPTSPTTLTNTASVSVNSYPSSASDTDTVMVPPTVTKSFSPSEIASGGASTLTVTLTNPNPVAISGAAFTDTYPSANLKNAATTNLNNTCGGTATGAAGASSLSLSGGTIPANGSCSVSISVTSATAGAYVNSSGAVTSTNAANGTAASATLVVMSPPTVTKSFSASPIAIGSTSTLTITLTNPNSAAITGAAFTDTYPAGMTNDATPGVSNNCGGSVTAAANGTSLSLSGGTIPANSNCSISVNVIGVQSGSFTNNTGTITTTNAGNGTAASATLVINTAREAWYPLDNVLNYWADSSGNGHTGTPVGITTSNIVATPAAGSKPETCSGANIPTDTVAANVYALNTGIDVRSLGATHGGAIAFWYKGKAAWNEGASNNYDRTLFDATGSGSGEFWLVLQQGGSLKFAIDSAANVSQTATSGVQNIAAGTWAHVAVTWDFIAGTMCVYVNGVLSGSCTSGITQAPSYGYLYMGDNRGNGYDVNRGNSADGVIDEVYLYNGALTAAEIQALMNAGHTCSNVDHYELSLPTSGITCLPVTATVTACSDSSSPCTSPFITVSGQTATLATSAGTLVPTTVTFNASGVASATLSYPAAADGAAATVTLSGEQTAAANPRKCCPDGINCVVVNSCSTTFNTAGFVFSSSAGGGIATIPTQVAGTSSGTYYLRAVKTLDNSSHTCGAAFSGAQSVNFAYECNDPMNCSGSDLMSINAGAATTIARNNNGGHASNTSVNMTFDANGNAPFTFNYSDVGFVTLWASKAAGGLLLSALTGSSNSFLVKPDHFDISNVIRTSDSFANPGATTAGGTAFIKAGAPFTATVTAMTSGGAATPNYGKESTPEGVKLTAALAPGLGLTNLPALTNDTIAGGEFGSGGMVNDANGIATVTNLAWNEVGIITLTPSVGDGDYLGAGDITGTASGNIGRFYAAQFALSGGVIANRTGLAGCPAPAGCGTFTYMGEQLSAVFNLIAKATDGTTTLLNYNWSATPADQFAKLNPMVAVTAGTGGPLGLGAVDSAATRTPFPPCGVTPAHPCLTPAQATAEVFASGEANVTVPFTIYRDNAVAAGPYALLDVAVAPQDSDGVVMAAYDRDTVNVVAGTPDHALVGQTQTRYGRMKLSNAHGSELLPLTINVTAQYWDGTTYVTNALDNNSTFAATDVIFGNYTKNLNAINYPNSGATAVTPASVVFVNGAASYKLAKPGVGNNGSVDMTVNALSAYLPSNTARATFGVYKGNNEFIYLRESY